MVKNKCCALILAAGKGKRMGGTKPKVLREIGGKPILHKILDNLKLVGIEKIIVVVGNGTEVKVKKSLLKAGYNPIFAYQEQPFGTGDATKVGLELIPSFSDSVLIMYGDDSALYDSKIVKEMLHAHESKKATMTILTIPTTSPPTFGALTQDEKGNAIGTMSYTNLIKNKVKNFSILCGLFVFQKKWLDENIHKVPMVESVQEYQLPHLIGQLVKQGKYPENVILRNKNMWNSVNTPNELKAARKKSRRPNYV